MPDQSFIQGPSRSVQICQALNERLRCHDFSVFRVWNHLELRFKAIGCISGVKIQFEFMTGKISQAGTSLSLVNRGFVFRLVFFVVTIGFWIILAILSSFCASTRFVVDMDEDDILQYFTFRSHLICRLHLTTTYSCQPLLRRLFFSFFNFNATILMLLRQLKCVGICLLHLLQWYVQYFRHTYTHTYTWLKRPEGGGGNAALCKE